MFLSGKQPNLNQSQNKKDNTPLHKAYKMKFSGGFNSGVEASLFIAKIVNAFKSNPVIRNLAVKVVSSAASHDKESEQKLMFEWVRDNIRYINDIAFVETLQLPTVTLPEKFSMIGIGAGDCDDHVILLATLLASIGVRNLFARVVSYKPVDKEYRHIYLVSKNNNKIISMDAIAKDKSYGWEVKHLREKDIKLI